MKQEKVSIIMGIYNCSNTLEEAIESIVNQTYENWELIMCDDGSIDATYDVAYKYVQKDPERFILLKNEKNMGLNYTLNRCLQVASGEYVARMDGDDLSMPTRLEREIEFLNEHPEFVVVSTPMIMFDENGDWGKTSVIEYPQVEDFCTHTPFFCHAACVIRKTVFLEVGGYTVDPKLLRVEDCHLWFKIYSKGYRGANLTEPLYKMRDDRKAINRRSWRARLNGCYVLYVGFKMLGFPWYKYVHVVKNTVQELIKFIIPLGVYEYLHKRRFKK